MKQSLLIVYETICHKGEKLGSAIGGTDNTGRFTSVYRTVDFPSTGCVWVYERWLGTTESVESLSAYIPSDTGTVQTYIRL